MRWSGPNGLRVIPDWDSQRPRLVGAPGAGALEGPLVPRADTPAPLPPGSGKHFHMAVLRADSLLLQPPGPGLLARSCFLGF